MSGNLLIVLEKSKEYTSIQYKKPKHLNISWCYRPGSQKTNGSGLKPANSREWWSARASVR